MTFSEENSTNYECKQMLGVHPVWQKSSIFADFSIKISANKLLDELRGSSRGQKLASKIYFEGLDRFICRGFKYEFLGFA